MECKKCKQEDRNNTYSFGYCQPCYTASLNPLSSNGRTTGFEPENVSSTLTDGTKEIFLKVQREHDEFPQDPGAIVQVDAWCSCGTYAQWQL